MGNDDLLLDNECPVCGAQPHEECESNAGHVQHTPHRERSDAEYLALSREHPITNSFI
jgi:hypothetical protein